MAFVRGANVVTEGLVLALDAANPKSYPGSGTTWRDLSGNGFTGSLINGPTFSTDSGGSIQFDGVDDTMNGATVFAESFTADFWFKPLQVRNFNPGFSIGSNLGAGGWGDFIFHTSSTGAIYAGSALDSRFEPTDPGCGAGTINVNFVCNITYTFVKGFSNGPAILYKNGALLSTKTLRNSLNPSVSSPISVGNSSNMMLYSWKMYNRALSAAEVLQNYNATKARFGIE